ncbi:mechanosensitive ion channel domain-containing protein [Stieleria tagensis]|uniref:mechanosensitive ion channel domain-containing protein n=1 Tax=Stieleria tagensis TaxID=2956795 RepID=UPI00209B9E7F|nr:mechanosensitive ion channel domain-containing protein [Stieleria tagensis]
MPFPTQSLGTRGQSNPTAANTTPPADRTPPTGSTTAGIDASAPDAIDEQLDGLRSRVEASQLSEEEKAPILQSIANTAKHQKDLRALIRASDNDKAAFETVSQRTEELKTKLSELRSQESAQTFQGTLAELETKLAALSAERASTKQAVSDAESAITRATQRRAEIESEIPKLNSALDEREAQAAAAATAGDGSLASEAMVAELKNSSALLKAQITALQNEQALLDAEVAANLPQLRRDRLARELELYDKQLQQLKSAIDVKRSTDAAERVRKAEQQVDELHPALKSIGLENQGFASLTQELAIEIERQEAKLNQRTLQLDRLAESFDDAENRVKDIGLTDAVGAMLRNLKQSLPNVSAYRFDIRERTETINNANYDLMDMTDRRNESMPLAVDALLRNSVVPIAHDERDLLEQEARELLQQQRTEFLDPAIRSQTRYFNTLFELTNTEEEIIQLVERSRRYINENVLWTRSTKPLTSQFVPSKSEWWFTLRSAWKDVGSRILLDVTRHPMSWFLATLALVLLVASRYRTREQIATIGQQASNSSFVRFYPTFQAFFLTVAASAPVPLLFWFLGNRFSTMASDDRTLTALALACKTFASTYALLELVRHVCRNKGLAECHFGWHSSAIIKIRRNLRLLLYIAVPLVTAANFLSAGGLGYGNDVLERYFTLTALAVLCLFLVRTVHPRRGVPAYFLANHPDGWANRLSSIWYPAVLAIPIALGVLTFIGYYFTGQQLGWRFFQSVALLFVIGVAVSMVIRWSLVHRRRLRLDQLRQQRASQGESGDAELPLTLTDESAEDLQDQMQQSRSLFWTAMVAFALIGLWVVWSDVVPALGFFERWPLWNSTQVVTELVTNENGDPVAQSRESIDPVTIAEVAVAILVLSIAFAAAKNLPGLLEFAVLRRLPLDRSVRYAVTTLVSYAIVLVGLVAAGNRVGLHWNQIQWMATALTFGLAFGLQEMFANFVAGIIILFEQPVRVGDVVEIEGVTGIVSKIRIRATTITDWDRKDYIVPNKEFITGQVLNWTRSDEIIRLTVPVGVAYGSDTVKARALLLEAAKEHPEVLSNPPILATFEGFGDSCLDFVLRVFIKTFERRLHVSHDLHMAIDKKFRQADIEISFPQRDLHLRSYPPEMVRFFESTHQESPSDQMQSEFER